MSIWTALPDETATIDLAGRLAAIARPGDVFALEGDLGAGKSTLARAFIRALTSPAEEVPSPTFTLVQVYDTRLGPLWHFDLYRLQNDADLVELGIDDAFAEGISLVEWPDRLGSWLPTGRLSVALAPGAGPTARQARLSGGGDWGARLAELFGG